MTAESMLRGSMHKDAHAKLRHESAPGVSLAFAMRGV